MRESQHVRERTTRIPRPPPPMAALSMTGYLEGMQLSLLTYRCVPSMLCKLAGLVDALERLIHPRDDGDAALDRGLACLGLVAHALDGFWQGSDKCDIFFRAAPSKGCVFAEKAVSGVHHIRAY